MGLRGASSLAGADLRAQDEGSDEGLTGNFGDRLGRAFSVACNENRVLRDYIHTPVRNYTIGAFPCVCARARTPSRLTAHPR